MLNRRGVRVKDKGKKPANHIRQKIYAPQAGGVAPQKYTERKTQKKWKKRGKKKEI